MTGIYKRSKNKGKFTQIDNETLQSLTDIGAIGLISHLMSLPSDWEIRKTYLYGKFSRSTVTKAIVVLEELKYWVHIEVRAGSQKKHFYSVSDWPFTDAEVIELLKEVKKDYPRINQISEPFHHLLTENLKEKAGNFSSANSEQKTKRRSHQPNQTAKDTGQILEPHQFESAIKAACDKLYPKYAPGRWDKPAWNQMIHTFITQTIESDRYINVPERKIPAYAKAAIQNMVHTNDDLRHKKENTYKTPDPTVLELLGTGAWLDW